MKKRRIAELVARWLLLAVAAAFVLSVALTYVLLTKYALKNTEDLLSRNVQDVSEDIRHMANRSVLDYAASFAGWIGSADGADSAFLVKLAETNDVAELNCVDKNGIIRASNIPEHIGYDMRSGEQSSEFLCLLEGETEYVQDYGPTTYDQNVFRKYSGAAFSDGGFLQVGLDGDQYFAFVASHAKIAVLNRHIGRTGSLLVCSGSQTVISSLGGKYQDRSLDETGLVFDPARYTPYDCFRGRIDGKDSFLMINETQGFYIIGIYPVSEAEADRTMTVVTGVLMETGVFLVLFLLLLSLLRGQIVNRITEVNRTLNAIAAGDLDKKVDVRSAVEFDELSDDINSTVDTLKRYIAEAAARIDQELEFARAIQLSSLPRIFPPYPDRTEFEIYASMNTAKEVGGDFYDFFLLGESRLAFLIADVSGKGIPAAMFMMTAKTLLKSYAEAGREVQEVLALANQRLCENNDAEMFVTAWMGILDLQTGRIRFANAGHNPPLVRRLEGGVSFLRTKPNLVLGWMEGLRFEAQSLELKPGEEIFLYTDGVTEASDREDSFYGEDRLLRFLQEHSFAGAEELCQGVKDDVDRFVGDAPQFDDITVLSLRYRGDKR